MKKSKLVALLSSFTSSELREFLDFVASPFFNKNKELLLFYQALKKIAPAFPSKKINREKVYKAVFPKKEFDEKHLNYLMSFLLKLAEQYIGYSKYQQQGTLPQYHILSSCIDRKLDKHYQNILSKTKSKLEKNPLRNINYYYQQYLIADIADKQFQEENIRKFDNNLQLASDYFDIYYISSKLKYFIEMLDRQQYLSADYQQNLIDEVRQYLANHKLDNIPPIAIYHRILLTLLKENANEHFNELKKIIQENVSKFTSYEMKQIYKAAINFCMRQIRVGKKRYQEELLELYLSGIETELLFENGFLSQWTYKNVVKLGLRMERFDWTEKFILQYSSKMDEEFQQNALHYNLAELNYYNHKSDAALEHLNKVEFSDIYYNLGGKTMLLKIYYENKEEEAMTSLLASFRIFLKRNKLISNDVRSTYFNFISILNMIQKKNAKRSDEIFQKIEKTSLLAERSWLKKMQTKQENLYSRK